VLSVITGAIDQLFNGLAQEPRDLLAPLGVALLQAVEVIDPDVQVGELGVGSAAAGDPAPAMAQVGARPVAQQPPGQRRLR
jgi:hypothetical protein